MRAARLGVRMDSLLLSCRTLSFLIACRFIPALGLSYPEKCLNTVQLLGGGNRFEIPAGKLQECRPVRRCSVTAAVLPEGYVTVDERGFDRRELGGPKIALAQEFVHGPGAGSGQEHALGIHPSIPIGSAGADEHRARRAQSNQLM